MELSASVSCLDSNPPSSISIMQHIQQKSKQNDTQNKQANVCLLLYAHFKVHKL